MKRIILGLTQNFISFFQRIRRLIAYISAIPLMFFAFMSTDPPKAPGLLSFKTENSINLTEDIENSKSGPTSPSKRDIAPESIKEAHVIKRIIRNLRRALDRTESYRDYADYIKNRIEKQSENDKRERDENIARAYREEAENEGTTPPY